MIFRSFLGSYQDFGLLDHDISQFLWQLLRFWSSELRYFAVSLAVTKILVFLFMIFRSFLGSYQDFGLLDHDISQFLCQLPRFWRKSIFIHL